MRKMKRITSFALAVCMGASLLATGPVTKVSAAEQEEIVTSEATETDAVAQGEDLSEEQEQVDASAGSAGSGWWDDYYSDFDYEGTTTEDENGFVWSKEDPTVLIDYKGTAETLVIPDTCTIIAGIIRNDAVKSLEIPASVEVIREGGCNASKYGMIGNEDGYFPLSQLQEIKVSPQNSVYSSPGNNVLINKKTNKLLKVTEKSTSVTIPSYITSIGSCAFYGCSGLTSIVIPESVTSIGDGAFRGCSSLTSIRIPSGVTSIGEWEFCDCSSLTSIEIPSGVTSISVGEFYGCSSLTSIKIPSGQKNIPSSAFGGCSSLTSIKIPDGVTNIENSAFGGCSSLKSIEIPNGVRHIWGSAFAGCSGLKSIKIPASVEIIEISILDGGHAFAGCSGLEKIIVDSNNKRYNSNGGCNAIIETRTNELILGCKNTRIPSNITSIGSCAFSGCSGLTNITIPAGVTEIGKKAFYDCKGLKSIEIPASVTKIYENDPLSIDYKLGSFYKSGLKTIYGYAGSYAETFAKKNGYQFVDVTVPAVPTVTNVQATVAGKNKVKVTWDKVSGATGYIVYARKNGKYAKLGVTAATSYTDTKALDNDYNFYFVYAYKKTADGKIMTGKCQKYAYAKGTCAAVTNLKASSVKGGVKLTWTKSAGADGYIVYGKKTNFKYGYIGMTTKNTATSYTDTKANKGSYNFYWVFPYHYDKNGKRVIGPICGYVYGRAK